MPPLCQDCHYRQIVPCPWCKKKVPRGIGQVGHPCVDLPNMFKPKVSRSDLKNPPLRRKVGENKGYCPDCGETSYTSSYRRHQQRRHHDIEPNNCGTRDHEKIFCPLCTAKDENGKRVGYYAFDSAQMHTHLENHYESFNYTCKYCLCNYRSQSQKSKCACKQKKQTMARKKRLGNAIDLFSVDNTKKQKK